MNLIRVITILCGVVLCWQPAAAVVVTYDFAATVTSQTGLGLSPGDALTGSFSYDNAVPDSNLAPDVGVYHQTQSLHFEVGAFSVTVPFSFLEIDNYTSPAANPDRLTGGNVSGNPWSVFMSFADSDQTVFASDALPALLPALSEFEVAAIDFDLFDGQEFVGSFTVNVTSLTLRQVPEPSSLAALGGVLLALALAGVPVAGRKRRRAVA